MIYHDFNGDSISAFAMGCMRLPVIDGDDGRIDEDAARDMVDYAFSQGVNYFDTAWGYHGGTSEAFLGRNLVSRYPRDSFRIATKFPGYDLDNFGKVEEIFEEQLARCRTDFFDYYLFHNVCELNIDAYLDDERFGTYRYLKRQKELGRIRHLGLSVHGSAQVLQRFLDAYGDEIEFCQIQLNYLDYRFQNAKAKADVCADRGIGIWVMEPMRGGMLTRASADQEERMRALRPDESPAAWSLRWLQAQPGVVTVLNGCSTLEQMRENIAVMSEEKPLAPEEAACLEAVAQERLDGKIAPCTACRYCTPHCPVGIDIPRLLELYNEHSFTGGGFIAPMALNAIDRAAWPDACIACGACAAVCPQQIAIPESLADFAALLEKAGNA